MVFSYDNVNPNCTQFLCFLYLLHFETAIVLVCGAFIFILRCGFSENRACLCGRLKIKLGFSCGCCFGGARLLLFSFEKRPRNLRFTIHSYRSLYSQILTLASVGQKEPYRKLHKIINHT